MGRGLGEATKSKTVGISGRVAEGDFAAEVQEIGIGERFFEEFFDDGQKVVEGANRAERGCGWWAGSAAGGGEQEGRLDNSERDLAMGQIAGQAKIETAETVGRFGQAEVEGGQGVEVGFRIGWHGGFFLTLFFGRRIPVRCRGRGSFGLR